ncbi:MAG TPA: hypothetical protein VM711_09005 [Sphingomicrobium sp.]|nr:hypothetical protein [Sphingomicrobium sp.]
MATPQRNVARGKGPAKPAPRAAAPARKPAPAANGHDDEPAALTGSFADLLEQAINAVPEEPELEPGDYRFRVKSVGPNKKQDRIMFVLAAIEDLSGALPEGADIAACRPVFMNFDPTRAGDMRQLNEIAAAAGVDVEMSKREMIEKKAFNGIELVGSVTKSDPAARDDGRVFTNVRGLRFPD